VLCAAGLLYLPVSIALERWRRSLKRGGLVAFSAMEAEQPRGACVFRCCAAACGIEVPNPNAALGTEARCRDHLEGAGFRIIRICTERIPFGSALTKTPVTESL
jgi:hypothetical protein